MKSRTTGQGRGRPREFSEEKAIEAATRMFAQKGYEGASLSDLTKAMGINRPSMYSAFGNKEKLFLRSLELFSRAGDEHVSQCMALGTARQGVDQLLRDRVMMFTDPKKMGGCFLTQGPLSGPDATEQARREVEYKRGSIDRTLRRRFDRAIEEGELPRGTASEDLARFYSVMVQGIALQAQHGGTREQLLRVVDVAMQSWPTKKSSR
jgi:AcrR family transcriptional regulator